MMKKKNPTKDRTPKPRLPKMKTDIIIWCRPFGLTLRRGGWCQLWWRGAPPGQLLGETLTAAAGASVRGPGPHLRTTVKIPNNKKKPQQMKIMQESLVPAAFLTRSSRWRRGESPGPPPLFSVSEARAGPPPQVPLLPDAACRAPPDRKWARGGRRREGGGSWGGGRAHAQEVLPGRAPPPPRWGSGALPARGARPGPGGG